MFEFHEEAGGKILIVQISGKLMQGDYRACLPDIERLIQDHGKIRMLCQMHDFHGWTAGALWEDFKFDLKHFADIERLALVGQRRWQAAMASICKPFTTAEVRYFDQHEIADAQEWIRSGVPNTTVTHELFAGHDRVQEASEESFPASDSPAY